MTEKEIRATALGYSWKGRIASIIEWFLLSWGIFYLVIRMITTTEFSQHEMFRISLEMAGLMVAFMTLLLLFRGPAPVFISRWFLSPSEADVKKLKKRLRDETDERIASYERGLVNLKARRKQYE